MNDFSHLAKMTNQDPAQRGALSLRSRLQIGSALVGAAMALTSPAMAFGGPECGPVIAGVVTCSGAYATGSTYSAGGQDNLTINIDPPRWRQRRPMISAYSARPVKAS